MLRTTLLLFAVLLPVLAARAAVQPAGRPSGPASGPEPAVATVAGEPITADVFTLRYGAYLLKTGAADTFPLRRLFLRSLVDHRLVVLALQEEGIAREEAYRFEEEAVRQKLLLEAYADRVLFDTMDVSDEELRALFVRINTRLTARHLYARTRAGADTLYARLQRGERFEDLAREVFADPVLAARGGSVGTFGFDEMDPAFEEAAFRLAVGEVSRPVQTASGFSIIQLQDRTVQPLLTETAFAEKRGQLRLYALRRKRSEALSRHSRELAAALEIVPREKAMARLLAQIEGTALAPRDEAAWLAEPLVAFGPPGARRTWTVADFREAARHTAPAQRAAVTSADHLARFLEGLVVRAELLARARAAGLDREPAYRLALAQEMEGWLYRQAQARIAAGVRVPEDSVRAFFAAHRDAYTVPEQVRVWEILVETKAEAERLRAQLGAASFEALARRHSLRPGADAAGGDLGFVSREGLGRLADAVFAAEEGAVLGPLEIAGRYALLRVGARRAARPAGLEEVRGRIVEALRERLAQQRFEAYLEALRTRYDVTVDERVLAAVGLPG